MPRPKSVIPMIFMAARVPEDLHTKLTLHLYSEVEGRIPQGAQQDWWSARIREFFGNKRLDLAPYANAEPGVYIVSGSPAAIEMLKNTLRGEHQ